MDQTLRDDVLMSDDPLVQLKLFKSCIRYDDGLWDGLKWFYSIYATSPVTGTEGKELLIKHFLETRLALLEDSRRAVEDLLEVIESGTNFHLKSPQMSSANMWLQVRRLRDWINTELSLFSCSGRPEYSPYYGLMDTEELSISLLDSYFGLVKSSWDRHLMPEICQQRSLARNEDRFHLAQTVLQAYGQFGADFEEGELPRGFWDPILHAYFPIEDADIRRIVSPQISSALMQHTLRSSSSDARKSQTSAWNILVMHREIWELYDQGHIMIFASPHVEGDPGPRCFVHRPSWKSAETEDNLISVRTKDREKLEIMIEDLMGKPLVFKSQFRPAFDLLACRAIATIGLHLRSLKKRRYHPLKKTFEQLASSMLEGLQVDVQRLLFLDSPPAAEIDFDRFRNMSQSMQAMTWLQMWLETKHLAALPACKEFDQLSNWYFQRFDYDLETIIRDSKEAFCYITHTTLRQTTSGEPYRFRNDLRSTVIYKERRPPPRLTNICRGPIVYRSVPNATVPASNTRTKPSSVMSDQTDWESVAPGAMTPCSSAISESPSDCTIKDAIEDDDYD